VVGRQCPRDSRRASRATREVGGVADERGDGGDSVADRALQTVAKPPPDMKHSQKSKR
jgi:hypothetical protein